MCRSAAFEGNTGPRWSDSMSARVIPPELRVDPEATVKTLETFVREQVRGQGFEHVVLGLSGGVDSAVVAALCVRALGPAQVTALLLPYKASADASREDALAVADRLDLETEEVDITPLADAYFAGRELDAIRKGNVLARLRMIVLFDTAKRLAALVAGTGNKTETWLGYSTWYGDSACSFLAIGDLYKSQVWQLAEWLKLPAAVIAKDPSADLWPGQTDEGELGITYAEADRILHALLDRGLRPAELVSEGAPTERVELVVKQIKATQFKRELPPVARISASIPSPDLTFAVDPSS
jgi:NAD+ synthase